MKNEMRQFQITFKPCEYEGEMNKINYNNQVRSRVMTKNVDDTKDFYAAMKLYDNLLYSNEYMLYYKLKEGK